MERLVKEKDLRLGAARLWRNIQVRRLAWLMATAAVVSLLAAWGYTALSANRLAQDWLTQQSALLGHLSESNPELAADWARLLAHPDRLTPEDIQRGQQIAKQYGLTPELKSQLSPTLQDYRARTAWLLTLGVLLLFGLLAALLVRENRRHLLEIRQLAVSLDNAVRHNERMDFRLYEEGEIGLLANSVQELAVRLQQTIEQLHRDKDFLKDTIADISHQLKTPLSSLIIYIDLLEQDQIDPETKKEFLQTCRRELDRMEWLTLTLLKIARLEADALPMHIRPVGIADTVKRATEAVRRLAQEHEVSLLTALPSEADEQLAHDPRWLTEAIVNLLKNAVEISPRGSVVRVTGESTAVFWRLVIVDQGPGIAAKHLPYIFRKFHRFSSGGSGVGLGLPLAKSIVERHGGMLTAASPAEGGARFVLTLPRHPLVTTGSNDDASNPAAYKTVSEDPGPL